MTHRYREVAEKLRRKIPLDEYADVQVIDRAIEAALIAAHNDGVENSAIVAGCWRDGNPHAIASVEWTARTISKAIRALKLKAQP